MIHNVVVILVTGKRGREYSVSCNSSVDISMCGKSRVYVFADICKLATGECLDNFNYLK